MSQVIAKFECIDVEDHPDQKQKLVDFTAVSDGSEENKSFAKATPSGGAYLNISYDTQAANFFEKGEEYLLTFTKVKN